MILLKNGWKICKFKKNYLPLHPLTSKRSGFSAVGSAHVWGARGRWFESSNPDKIKEDMSTDTSSFCFMS